MPVISTHHGEDVTVSDTGCGPLPRPLSCRHAQRRSLATGDLSDTRGAKRAVFAGVEPDEVRAALETFRGYDDHTLSFTDATSIALCGSRGIDAVLSFDDDFDGLVDRIDPADA